MMGHKEKFISGYEYDTLTSWRHNLNWKTGERKEIKNRIWKRIRKETRLELREVTLGHCSSCGEPINYGVICEVCKELYYDFKKGDSNGQEEETPREKAKTQEKGEVNGF